MADVATIGAVRRERSGTGGARAARRQGFVPGIIYGVGEVPLPVQLDRRLLDAVRVRPGFFNRLLDIDLGGERLRVLPREVQLHPLTDAAIHVDLMRATDETEVTVDVPVHFENETASPGIKRGGVLNVVRHAIEVRCRAAAIPTHFAFDLAGLEIGSSIHASHLQLPEGVVPTITERDFTIATIAAPTVVAEEAAAARPAAEGEAPEEGAAEGAAPPAAEGAKPAAGSAGAGGGGKA
jgi:large subunit ribosomal protein L25